MKDAPTCPTCDGEGRLVFDDYDHRGEHIDRIEDCPDCTSDDGRDAYLDAEMVVVPDGANEPDWSRSPL